MPPSTPRARVCVFVGSARRDLVAFPEQVRAEIGFALYEAQRGAESSSVKALKGFGGRGVLEIVENHDGETYRAVYTVRFEHLLYVLHCFQKKSVKGIATPQRQIDVIRSRLVMAEADFARRKGGQMR